MASIGHNQKTFRSPNSISDAERKQLMNVLQELNDSMARAASERDFQKEAVQNICEKLDFNPKVLRKIAKVYYKSNFSQESSEQDEFETFYQLIVNNKGV